MEDTADQESIYDRLRKQIEITQLEAHKLAHLAKKVSQLNFDDGFENLGRRADKLGEKAFQFRDACDKEGILGYNPNGTTKPEEPSGQMSIFDLLMDQAEEQETGEDDDSGFVTLANGERVVTLTARQFDALASGNGVRP